MCHLKVDSCFIRWEYCRTSSPGGSISCDPERTAPRSKGGAGLYRSFATKGRTRYPKARNFALFCVWEDSRVWGSLKSFLWYAPQLLWLSPSSLPPPAWQGSESETSVEARNRTLFRKPANWEDGRLMSQNNHLLGVWMPGSFIGQREVRNQKGNQSRKYLLEWPASPGGGLISSFL